ncbi:unnamed protein product [Mycena citricolor]|uniref:HTH CENPB-type domain-containing protein n=1 Tax=Mycena citricolor TaxID=2018698 RepID=A0AAD2Q7H0_9AGAR|nr:unnamed protein product [Mycena citricolor]
MQRAVDLYLADQQRPLAPKERRKGTRYFCEIVEEEFRAEYKRSIHLSHMTCSRWAEGKRSRANANAARSWLLPEEAETVLQYVEEMSIRGLPLDHEGLREVVEGILRARLHLSYHRHHPVAPLRGSYWVPSDVALRVPNRYPPAGPAGGIWSIWGRGICGDQQGGCRGGGGGSVHIM